MNNFPSPEQYPFSACGNLADSLPELSANANTPFKHALSDTRSSEHAQA